MAVREARIPRIRSCLVGKALGSLSSLALKFMIFTTNLEFLFFFSWKVNDLREQGREVARPESEKRVQERKKKLFWRASWLSSSLTENPRPLNECAYGTTARKPTRCNATVTPHASFAALPPPGQFTTSNAMFITWQTRGKDPGSRRISANTADILSASSLSLHARHELMEWALAEIKCLCAFPRRPPPLLITQDLDSLAPTRITHCKNLLLFKL
ncbi:hypothetical protein FOTG_14058 [Fusarium oxysporum f. sp. vasinfectum 25433]|uniref:Uncharacterized protein n=1 Tax=Fusarium oxysporum f. sp. vasinfectum 25433 TaxID=1089449 RepID=X0MB40_FUSOX|nr:hypothetical protein FOTG_14058 [Fusarium oxysporum f. sp. vasinfectum 25433]EXM17816.1 hypothetical protein FOTG_14058 [Fusarium oxysporum f. sp. vasinfectum 25433]EXM17817.1 hypothetical protein FOTG_14058 [Fusarium oxysporum f. sp. vasinfectum 25433]EXM17818.1 hypothetical protein FOTG_14058 [Fusarium oxysporum f. sp. vasinfectum 25433]EXM17819.1 hypothetical protein FOTG_14058 [Fusarium oxysporum f. sp. vasinfectum 25433]